MPNNSEINTVLAAKERRLALLKKKKSIQDQLPHLYGWPWYSWANEFFNNDKDKVQLLCAANQISKAIDVDEEILTDNRGWIRYGDLQIGDKLFGRDGSVVRVVGIPFRGRDTSFRFSFNDGSSVISSKAHRWVCKSNRERFRRVYTNGFEGTPRYGRTHRNKTYGTWVEKTTQEIFDICGENPKPFKRVSIPVSEPICPSEPSMVFDPYLMGLLLGDGSFKTSSTNISSADVEVIDYIRKKREVKRINRYDFRILGLTDSLSMYGLIGCGSEEKFIPNVYFKASKEDRFSLLQGLMDTDGTISNESSMSFVTVSPHLADGVKELVLSLGGICTVSSRYGYYRKNGLRVKCKKAYTLRIRIRECPFRLKRKRKRFKEKVVKHERIITKIEPVGVKDVMCITVDSDDGTFLIGRDMIVTHNSSTQIRKAIHWATAVNKWKKLWGRAPNVFWYLYPTQDVATVEFEKKWVPEFLPYGAMKEDPVFGWRAEYDKKKIQAIHFRSGVSIYFKVYAQKASHLQSGTVYSIFCDEELPDTLYDELQFRLSATDGFFHMVFTATMGQELWWRAMECVGQDTEFLPNAWKKSVSMYDCTKYKDGSDSPWTNERIKKVEQKCQSEAEVRRRVHGRFVTEKGRKYPTFSLNRHYVAPFKIPDNFIWYSGIDIGSGGKTGHPSAICFIAVSPDYKKGYVVESWRGDGILTTAGDVLDKYLEIRGRRQMTRQFYDFAAKDFGTIATRLGESLEKAEKSHELGENILNTLFKNDMLLLFDNDENRKLGSELLNLSKSTSKTKAKDDLVDAARYGTVSIPWDFSSITAKYLKKPETRGETDEERSNRARRGEVLQSDGWFGESDEISSEIALWNETYES